MEKDNAVRNQKVFITLEGYTQFAAEYQRICVEFDQAMKENVSAVPGLRTRRLAFEYAIDTLGLPIPRRSLYR